MFSPTDDTNRKHSTRLERWTASRRQEDVYLCRDPARLPATSTLEAGALERARTAFGTDEDVLVVAARGGRSSYVGAV